MLLNGDDPLVKLLKNGPENHLWNVSNCQIRPDSVGIDNEKRFTQTERYSVPPFHACILYI